MPSACPPARLWWLSIVETRKTGNFHGEIGEAVGEVLRVLLDQKRGRGEYGDLFAAHHRYKRGAQGDFGFAETDIAAHKASIGFACVKSLITAAMAAAGLRFPRSRSRRQTPDSPTR